MKTYTAMVSWIVRRGSRYRSITAITSKTIRNIKAKNILEARERALNDKILIGKSDVALNCIWVNY